MNSRVIILTSERLNSISIEENRLQKRFIYLVIQLNLNARCFLSWQCQEEAKGGL